MASVEAGATVASIEDEGDGGVGQAEGDGSVGQGLGDGSVDLG